MTAVTDSARKAGGGGVAGKNNFPRKLSNIHILIFIPNIFHCHNLDLLLHMYFQPYTNHQSIWHANMCNYIECSNTVNVCVDMIYFERSSLKKLYAMQSGTGQFWTRIMKSSKTWMENMLSVIRLKKSENK